MLCACPVCLWTSLGKAPGGAFVVSIPGTKPCDPLRLSLSDFSFISPSGAFPRPHNTAVPGFSLFLSPLLNKLTTGSQPDPEWLWPSTHTQTSLITRELGGISALPPPDQSPLGDGCPAQGGTGTGTAASAGGAATCTEFGGRCLLNNNQKLLSLMCRHHGITHNNIR